MKILERVVSVITIILLGILLFSAGYRIGRNITTSKIEQQKEEAKEADKYDHYDYKIEQLEKNISDLYDRVREDERLLGETVGEAAYAKAGVDTLTEYLKSR